MPDFLHDQFTQQLGGDVDALLTGWYREWNDDAKRAARPIANALAWLRARYAATVREVSGERRATQLTLGPMAPARTSGSICPHAPRCATWQACIDRTLAEGRAEREQTG